VICSAAIGLRNVIVTPRPMPTEEQPPTKEIRFGVDVDRVARIGGGECQRDLLLACATQPRDNHAVAESAACVDTVQAIGVIGNLHADDEAGGVDEDHWERRDLDAAILLGEGRLEGAPALGSASEKSRRDDPDEKPWQPPHRWTLIPIKILVKCSFVVDRA